MKEFSFNLFTRLFSWRFVKRLQTEDMKQEQFVRAKDHNVNFVSHVLFTSYVAAMIAIDVTFGLATTFLTLFIKVMIYIAILRLDSYVNKIVLTKYNNKLQSLINKRFNN